MYANISDMPFDQKSSVHQAQTHDSQTTQFRDWIGEVVQSSKISCIQETT